MLQNNPNELFGQPNICCLQETHFRCKDTHRLKVNRLKKVFHANGNQRKTWAALLVSYKIDFKIKVVIRDEES